MNPNNDQHDRRVVVPSSNHARTITPPQRDSYGSQSAAANIIREQINSIYSGNSNQNTPHTTPAPQAPISEATTPVASTSPPPQKTAAEMAKPYDSNHGLQQSSADKTAATTNTATPTATRASQAPRPQPKANAEQWKQYHSAWQKYYQLYYERYYANHLNAKQQEFQEFIKNSEEKLKKANAAPQRQIEEDPQQEAIQKLRSQIQQKVRESTKKVKKSKHFVPILAGVVVLAMFMFLQYNRILFGVVAAYTTPGNIDPQNIIVDPSVESTVGPEPKMIIPKLNIDAPVVYGVSADHKSQMKAMEKGIAHFSIPGANAVPGQIGNTVLAAHSSNDAFATGDYKFVFAQNEKLKKGDLIYMNYNSKRYTYSVTSLEVVLPREVSKVQIQTNKPMLTLVSCVPIGTAEKRLLVFAEQISPSPDTAEASSGENAQPVQQDKTNIPGKPSPTLIERIFGAR